MSFHQHHHHGQKCNYQDFAQKCQDDSKIIFDGSLKITLLGKNNIPNFTTLFLLKVMFQGKVAAAESRSKNTTTILPLPLLSLIVGLGLHPSLKPNERVWTTLINLDETVLRKLWVP